MKISSQCKPYRWVWSPPHQRCPSLAGCFASSSCQHQQSSLPSDIVPEPVNTVVLKPLLKTKAPRCMEWPYAGCVQPTKTDKKQNIKPSSLLRYEQSSLENKEHKVWKAYGGTALFQEASLVPRDLFSHSHCLLYPEACWVPRGLFIHSHCLLFPEACWVPRGLFIHSHCLLFPEACWVPRGLFIHSHCLLYPEACWVPRGLFIHSHCLLYPEACWVPRGLFIHSRCLLYPETCLFTATACCTQRIVEYPEACWVPRGLFIHSHCLLFPQTGSPTETMQFMLDLPPMRTRQKVEQVKKPHCSMEPRKTQRDADWDRQVLDLGQAEESVLKIYQLTARDQANQGMGKVHALILTPLRDTPARKPEKALLSQQAKWIQRSSF